MTALLYSAPEKGLSQVNKHVNKPIPVEVTHNVEHFLIFEGLKSVKMCTFIDLGMSHYEDLFDIVFEFFFILQGKIESLGEG